jgi:alkyl-hydroperoxide reductase/thiol specific antioxidant family protein
LRRSHHEITALGADVVAIGTGDVRYAKAFVADEEIPFLVLVDDQALAARAASVPRASWLTVARPASWSGSRRAWADGFRIHKSGKRVTQLGATFVVGPGPQLHYQHLDGDSSDHAPLDAVIGALPEPTEPSGA